MDRWWCARAASTVTTTLVRIHADANGETHLTHLGISAPPEIYEGGPRMVSLPDIPGATVNIVELLEPQPAKGLHPGLQRMFVIVLQGEFEVTTTSGDRHLFRPGHCLFADDMGSKGHTYEDRSEDLLICLHVILPPDWDWTRHLKPSP